VKARAKILQTPVFSAFAASLLGLAVVQGVHAEEADVATSPQNASPVTVEHLESNRVSTGDSSEYHDGEVTDPEEYIEYVEEPAITGELDYDHCHFDESHQHHHCYDAGEHEHEETRTYTRYATRTPVRRYYSSRDHYSSHRHYSHRNDNSWNSVALGLAIGLPLAYSHNYYDRGRHGYYSRGYRNHGYRARGYRNNGYRNHGYRNHGFRNKGYRNTGNYRKSYSSHGGKRRGRH